MDDHLVASSPASRWTRMSHHGSLTSTELRLGLCNLCCSTFWSCDHKLVEKLQEVLLHTFISKPQRSKADPRWRRYFNRTLWFYFKLYFALFFFFTADRGVFLDGKRGKNEITLEISFKAVRILECPLQRLGRIYLFLSSTFFSHFTLSLFVTA